MFNMVLRSLPVPRALRWHPSTPTKLSERLGAPRGESGSNVVPTLSHERRVLTGYPLVGTPYGCLWGHMPRIPGSFDLDFTGGHTRLQSPHNGYPVRAPLRPGWSVKLCSVVFLSLNRQCVPSDMWCGVNGHRQCCGALRWCPTTPTTQPSFRRVARCHGGVGVERRTHVVTCT
jgi:hypothetical protein